MQITNESFKHSIYLDFNYQYRDSLALFSLLKGTFLPLAFRSPAETNCIQKVNSTLLLLDRWLGFLIIPDLTEPSSLMYVTQPTQEQGPLGIFEERCSVRFHSCTAGVTHSCRPNYDHLFGVPTQIQACRDFEIDSRTLDSTSFFRSELLSLVSFDVFTQFPRDGSFGYLRGTLQCPCSSLKFRSSWYFVFHLILSFSEGPGGLCPLRFGGSVV